MSAGVPACSVTQEEASKNNNSQRCRREGAFSERVIRPVTVVIIALYNFIPSNQISLPIKLQLARAARYGEFGSSLVLLQKRFRHFEVLQRKGILNSYHSGRAPIGERQ